MAHFVHAAANVEAVRMAHSFSVADQKGKAGDWLVTYHCEGGGRHAAGPEQIIVNDRLFREMFTPADNTATEIFERIMPWEESA